MALYYTKSEAVVADVAELIVESEDVDRMVYHSDVTGQFGFSETTAAFDASYGFGILLPAGEGLWFKAYSSGSVGLLVTKVPSASITFTCS